MPLHLLVKWEVVSSNSREGQLQSISIISSIPLFWFCISNVGVVGGIQNKYFSFNVFFVFFFVCWKYCKVPLHLQLLVKWEVVSPNSRYREFYHEIGNIEKFPFTYWLNGRWFLNIVNMHVGNFDMKLTGRWFPQIVDRDGTVGIYIQYIYNKNCGVSFWTCSREISGDRVSLLYVCLLCYEVLLPWNFRSPGFDVRAPQDPPNMKKKYFFFIFWV